MVARLNTPHRLHDALNYNEQKVKKNVAECIHASGSLKDTGEMKFSDKIELLENRNRLNDRASTKTLHVSLNFDSSEKLSNEEMTAIATCYMEKLGFAEQPYLVYRHHDAGHPHLHIVSSTIREDGSRINTHNIGRNQSEQARKETEQLFHLVKAERLKQSDLSISQVYISPVQYGSEETRKAITRVVTAVIREYMFTSLPEFNAALQQFNVIADRGLPGSRLHDTGGLVYRVLNHEGNKVGVPLKASRIGGKPILKKLEQILERNKELREPFKSLLRDRLNLCRQTPLYSLQEWLIRCRQQGIYAILRQNDTGRAYGITYVDNRNKCVFNGSDLGKTYSLSGLLKSNLKVAAVSEKIDSPCPESRHLKIEQQPALSKTNIDPNPSAIPDRQSFEHMPYQFLKRKRRKKKN